VTIDAGGERIRDTEKRLDLLPWAVEIIEAWGSGWGGAGLIAAFV